MLQFNWKLNQDINGMSGFGGYGHSVGGLQIAALGGGAAIQHTLQTEPNEISDGGEQKHIREEVAYRKYIWIIISAIIFTVVVAIYEIIKIAINNYFSMKSANHAKCGYTDEERHKIIITNYNQLLSACVFGVIAFITAVVIISVLYQCVL